MCIKALNLQTRTLNLGHTGLEPAVLSSNVVCSSFFVELSNFETDIERERVKDVKHNMSTLLLQLT